MKYFFSTLTLLALILSGCQSQKVAMEALSGQTFYAYSLSNGTYRESPFPLLPKDAWEQPYKYLHFQLQMDSSPPIPSAIGGFGAEKDSGTNPAGLSRPLYPFSLAGICSAIISK